ncbi:MAG: hypothetical protein FWD60_11960 [Candidatus Azobacteroides sp.]|nr:hypothetical protein [Candidatus Azobacteroides sp.]
MKNTGKDDLVVFNENVKFTFFELIDVLYQKGYFGFLDEAKEYVSEIEQYFKTEIPKLHRLGLSKKAMPYFRKYGESLYFATYIRTKTRTTWYALYEVFGTSYFKVVHITNNHTEEAAYIEHIY